jgi:hypothetical protein
MKIVQKQYYYLILLLACLTVLNTAGCESNSRVFFTGAQSKKTVSAAALTTESAQDLINAGYVKIGMIQSESTMCGESVSKQEFNKNPQAVIDSIAPENKKTLANYYSSLDKEACCEAAKAGGEKIRLEEIKHSYPYSDSNTVSQMNKAMADGLTIKFVSSIKYWSVWKKGN